MGRFDVHFAVPFLEISGWRMRAVGKVGEAVLCCNATPVATEKASDSLTHEPIVIEFGKSARGRFLVEAKCLSCGTARAMHLAVVKVVITEPCAQINP